MKKIYFYLALLVIVFFVAFNLRNENYIADQAVSVSESIDLDSLVWSDNPEIFNIEDSTVQAIQKPGQDNFFSDKPNISQEDLVEQISSILFSQNTPADILSNSISIPLDGPKQIEMEALENRYSSQQVTRQDLHFDLAGNISSISHDFFLQVSNSNTNLFENQIRNIVNDHPNLFGLGENGLIDDVSTLCTRDICVTTVEKSFYDLPAWDHELKMISSDNTIFSISGNFNSLQLAPPPSFNVDDDLVIENISKYLDIASSNISLLDSPQLGINHLNGLDSYSFKY